MEAREQFYNEFTKTMNEQGMSIEEMTKVQKILSSLLCKYSVSPRETQVVVYQGVPSCVKDYIAIRKIDGLANISLEHYARILNRFFQHVKIPIADITVNDIRRYLWDTKEETGCSDRTLESVRGIIATFFAWANAEEYIPRNPCVSLKTIKYTVKKRGHLTDMEVEKVRSVVKDKREKAVLETFLSTGCRVRELTNLKISDLDFEKKEVLLFGKGSKYRTSYLNSKAIIAIKDYLEERNDDSPSLFVSTKAPHQALTTKWIEEMIRDLGVRAKLTQNIYPHLLRHTTATLAMSKGMPPQEIQKLLGHVNIATTMIYADVIDDNLKLDHQKFIC